MDLNAAPISAMLALVYLNDFISLELEDKNLVSNEINSNNAFISLEMISSLPTSITSTEKGDLTLISDPEIVQGWLFEYFQGALSFWHSLQFLTNYLIMIYYIME
jgi:hypothetical protein